MKAAKAVNQINANNKSITSLQDFLKNELGIEIDEQATFEEVNNILKKKNIDFNRNNTRERITDKQSVCKYVMKEIEAQGFTTSRDVNAAHPSIYSRYLDVKHVSVGGNIARISFPALFRVAAAFGIKIEFIVEHESKIKKTKFLLHKYKAKKTS